MVKIAIAGAGDMARYFAEELLAKNFEVVVLSRSPKPYFDNVSPSLELRITDYSVPSLVKAVKDCDGVVSGILDYSMNNATVHLALLEACLQTKCKRFIPSEYGGNLDEFPDQPAFYFANHEPVREALRKQSEVEWTLLNGGWLADYLVPVKQRYIKDIGPYFPVDFHTNTMKIPGTGNERIEFTAARDYAKAVAALFATSTPWDKITYIGGDLITWNELAKLMEKHGHKFEVSYRPFELLQKQIAEAKTEDEVIAAQYEDWSVSGAGFLPQDKLKEQAEKYFKGVHFRSVEEFLVEGEQKKDLQVAL